MKHAKLVFILFLLATLLTACAPPRAGKEPLTKTVWTNLQYYFGLDWIFKATEAEPATVYVTFVRMILILIIFLILFELFSHIPGLNQASKRTALILSLALSALIAVFFPPALLLTIAITYTGFFAFFLVGIPTALAIWLAYAYEPSTSKGYLMRAVFLLLALWVVGVMIHWSATQLTDVDPGLATGPRQTIESLQALESLEKFGTWMWWILAGLIVYNLWHGIFGVGSADQALSATGAHSRTFLGNIADAWKGAAEKGIAKKALPKEAMTEELQLEAATDKVLKKLQNASVVLEFIRSSTTSPLNRPVGRIPALITSAVRGRETEYLNNLEETLRIVRDDMIGLSALPARRFSALPAPVRNSLRRIFDPRTDDIPTLLVERITQLRTAFQATLGQPANVVTPTATAQKTFIDGFLVPLVRAFAAANKP